MLAAVDIGSNTLRLLFGEVVSGRVVPHLYERFITRLGGSFDPHSGLAPASCQRTLEALETIAAHIASHDVQALRVVGTEALRRAANAAWFVRAVHERTSLELEIISGDEEARLSSTGVLGILDPLPGLCLIIDIGGGSTELTLCRDGAPVHSRSYPVGTVRLCEEHPGDAEQEQVIAGFVRQAREDLLRSGCMTANERPLLVGTAGTVTTLAALDLEMRRYDWRRVNNHSLAETTLRAMRQRLSPMTSEERERLPGMEKGRGDLIVPGLKIVIALLESIGLQRLVVSDFGLLEGILTDLALRNNLS